MVLQLLFSCLLPLPSGPNAAFLIVASPCCAEAPAPGCEKQVRRPALTSPNSGDRANRDSPSPPLLPPLLPKKSRENGIRWGRLADDSLRFLAVMHAFRWAKEAGTRSGGVGIGQSYFNSVGNLHGWADGDPFYVNYVGHPMQGAVSGRLFLINDPKYNRAEFGDGPEYWKAKLRATVFAWAFSEQFEIGLLSEASIGRIQGQFPQQGFVDHVITPIVGFGWMTGEDALDRYVIRRIEGRTTNRWIRIAARTGLNPARSFANLLDGRAPWDRASRPGILSYQPQTRAQSLASVGSDSFRSDIPAPFEFSITSGYRQFASGPCLGGGGEAAYRLAPNLQFVLAVNGCKLLKLATDFSGDGLVFQAGPRWTPAPTGKWSPFGHVLVGGMKVTQEELFPQRKAEVEAANANIDPSLAYTLHDQYTSHAESTGLAVTAGAGLDYKLNDALAIRVANFEYLYSTMHPVNGASYANGFQFTTGMVLRLGTW
jgi:hypothetical protein